MPEKAKPKFLKFPFPNFQFLLTSFVLDRGRHPGDQLRNRDIPFTTKLSKHSFEWARRYSALNSSLISKKAISSGEKQRSKISFSLVLDAIAQERRVDSSKRKF